MPKRLANGINSGFRAFFAWLVAPAVSMLTPYRSHVLVANLANIISTTRLIACVYVDAKVAMAPSYQARLVWLAVVLVLMLSDGIDGALARGLKIESQYGTRVDPLADKILYGGLLVGLIYRFASVLFTGLASIIIVIEVLNVVFGQKLSNLALSLGKVAASGLWGKLKFGVQCVMGILGWLIPDNAIAMYFCLTMMALIVPLAYLSFNAYRKRVTEFRQELAGS